MCVSVSCILEDKDRKLKPFKTDIRMSSRFGELDDGSLDSIVRGRGLGRKKPHARDLESEKTERAL